MDNVINFFVSNASAIITIVTISGAFYGFFRNLKIDLKIDKSDLKSDIKRLDDRIAADIQRIDGWIQHMTAMQAEQAKRTDKLHEMFYELLKAKGN